MFLSSLGDVVLTRGILEKFGGEISGPAFSWGRSSSPSLKMKGEEVLAFFACMSKVLSVSGDTGIQDVRTHTGHLLGLQHAAV